MPWPIASLGEVVTINPRGESLRADDEVSFVGMAELDAETAVARPRGTRAFSDVSKGYTIFRDRDVLAAKITPCWENGKVGQARLGHPVGVGSTEFHVLRPSNAVDDRYLLHFLRQPSVRRNGERRMTGSAGQRRVPVAFLADLKLPLPPIDEQRRIAEILDRVDALRAKRRETLALLDDLTQSIFLERFGDLRENPRGWAVASVSDVAERVTDGEHKTPRRVKSGIPLLSARNVRDGWIDFAKVDYIDEVEYANLSRRISPATGDILISCSGTIGRVAQVREQTHFSMVRSAALVRPNERVHPTFLESLLASRTLQLVMQAQANSSAQANLFQNQIKRLPVFVPPMARQIDFAATVERFISHRAAVHAAASADGQLFGSLQQRAFAGQL